MISRILMPHRLLIVALLFAACGSGNTPGRALDRHLSAEIDSIEASLRQAETSEQERAAVSEMHRKCLDLGLATHVEVFDQGGAQIPTGEWDRRRERLENATVKVTLTSPKGPGRTISHRVIDPDNFVYFLMGE